MPSNSLNVLIAGKHAGLLSQDHQGRLSFTYDSDYSGPPLSIALPISNRSYKDKLIRPYLFGLLPDDPAVRRSLGAKHGISGNNPFALLRHSGLDCPGAVQICDNETLESMPLQESLLRLNEKSIAQRLKESRLSREASWTDAYEHWSLGGQQSKFALRLKDNQWFKCLGASATTHIFKPGIHHLKHQALNEYVCMRLASTCSIPAADVSFQSFCDESALIVTRYDRFTTEAGTVIRLHQEDLCQALGVLPENKYTENGGPGSSAIIDILAKTGPFSKANITRFCQMIFFNYLIGAPDAHAKNYSLLHGLSGEVVLAPLYDAASMLPYLRKREQMKTAMSIGGENKVGHLKRSNLKRFVESNALKRFDINSEACEKMLIETARGIIDSASNVFDEAEKLSGGVELREKFEGPLLQHCERTVEIFSKHSS